MPLCEGTAIALTDRPRSAFRLRPTVLASGPRWWVSAPRFQQQRLRLRAAGGARVDTSTAHCPDRLRSDERCHGPTRRAGTNPPAQWRERPANRRLRDGERRWRVTTVKLPWRNNFGYER